MTIVEYTAKELRKLRAEKDVSQKEVCSAISLDIGSLVRYENASVSINIVNLKKLLDYYNVSITDFFKCY